MAADPVWESETLPVGDVALALRSLGAGEPLVLVHGTGVDRHAWDVIAPLLAGRHRVVSYDRRGYGASSHAPVRDYRLHIGDLAALLEHTGPAHLLGWSSGGNAAIAVALRRPDLVRTLTVLEAPFHGTRAPTADMLAAMAGVKWRQLRGRPREGAEVFLRWASGRRDGASGYDRLPVEEREELLGNAAQILVELDPHPSGVMVEHVSTRSLQRLAMPVTWLMGEQTLPWYDVLRRRALAQVPHAVTVRIPDAGHLALVENPEAMAEAVLAATAH